MEFVSFRFNVLRCVLQVAFGIFHHRLDREARDSLARF